MTAPIVRLLAPWMQPGAFFADARRWRGLPRAFGVLVASALPSLIAASWLVQRVLPDLPASLPWLAMAAAIPYLALLIALGSLLLMRLTGLQAGAVELLAWAWTPMLPVAIGSVLVGLAAPLTALALGFTALPVAHVALLGAAVRALGANNPQRVVGVYLAFVFVLPTVIVASALTVLLTAGAPA